MRILHFSDVHLSQPWRTVPFSDWLGKRLLGASNLALGRAGAFADARQKVDALDRFRREHDVDLVIFTGDYTALGTEAELREARVAVEPLMAAPEGYVHVPGNHDLYTASVLRERRFQRHFGDTLATDLPEYRTESNWPLARLVGDDVAVVAVNSARPSPWPWLSTGKIPEPELEALELMLGDERVRNRFVFVITHYAPRLASGKDDHRLHSLVNADEFLGVCRRLERGAILFGHVHKRFHLRVPTVEPSLFCAGSTTKAGAEGLWLFEVDGGRARATAGTWSEDRYHLEPDRCVEL